jgi:hypothetical protein
MQYSASFSGANNQTNKNLTMARTEETQFSHYPKFDKKRRISCLTSGPKMSGKFFLLILTLTFRFVFPKSPSTLIGGLVYYKENSKGPIYLNSQFYTITREVDSSWYSWCKHWQLRCSRWGPTFMVRKTSRHYVQICRCSRRPENCNTAQQL